MYPATTVQCGAGWSEMPPEVNVIVLLLLRERFLNPYFATSSGAKKRTKPACFTNVKSTSSSGLVASVSPALKTM